MKKLEDMNLMDDFLNNAAAGYEPVSEELYRTILEVLLERSIGKIRIINQKVIAPPQPGLRGIRLDVEISEYDDNDNVVRFYDYEPHKGSKSDYDFPLYNRYRQARMDSRMMRNGDSDFRHMPELYIITITDYDIFGEKGIVYSFENRCVEYPNVQYDDRLHFIYFNTRGTHGGSTRIKNMLTYIQDSRHENVVDESTEIVDSLVSRVKCAEEVRGSYMTFGDVIDREKKESFEAGVEQGMEQGIEQGIARGFTKSISNMLDNGRTPEEIAEFTGYDLEMIMRVKNGQPAKFS